MQLQYKESMNYWKKLSTHLSTSVIMVFFSSATWSFLLLPLNLRLP